MSSQHCRHIQSLSNSSYLRLFLPTARFGSTWIPGGTFAWPASPMNQQVLLEAGQGRIQELHLVGVLSPSAGQKTGQCYGRNLKLSHWTPNETRHNPDDSIGRAKTMTKWHRLRGSVLCYSRSIDSQMPKTLFWCVFRCSSGLIAT